MNAQQVISNQRRWSIEWKDCLKWLSTLPRKVDLIFADPPFNIGYEYDVYNDRMERNEYLQWTGRWLRQSINTLKPHGSMVVAINDENAAEVKIMAEDRGVYLRNWIIWYYTFGTHQKKKFGRSKTHLLYFTKHRTNFTFNADAVREESERQRIGDKRADPRGRVPPDVWKMSRLCGTFKERTGHPCQMNEKVLERIIRACTNPDDVVCDPFGGSFTTSAVAHKLGRRSISCDTSKAYCRDGRKRLEKI